MASITWSGCSVSIMWPTPSITVSRISARFRRSGAAALRGVMMSNDPLINKEGQRTAAAA